MKTRVLSLMLFALLFAAFACPAAANDALDAENEVYAEAYELLDPQSKALLSRLGVEGGDLTSLLTFSPASLAELVRDAFAAAGQESRETFLSAGLILLLTGILLPLCLMDEDVPDCALVTNKDEHGRYEGRTILTLRMAYKNARLLCRPESEWLSV